MSKTFRPFKKKESRRQFTNRVHSQVEQGDTINDLWRVYFDNRFAIRVDRPLDADMIGILREVFYAGIASMFQLMTKMAGDDADELGAERLQRLYEELETYTKNLR